MPEDELIWAMCCAYDEANDEEGIDVAMSRVLAVVRSHDAARVPADAELDEAQSRASSYTYETRESSGAVNLGEVIAALRRRVAELEAERDKLQDANMWRPIETAPETGEFLVGVWVGSRWSHWVASGGEDLGNDGEFGDPPTHWRPSPPLAEPPPR